MTISRALIQIVLCGIFIAVYATQSNADTAHVSGVSFSYQLPHRLKKSSCGLCTGEDSECIGAQAQKSDDGCALTIEIQKIPLKNAIDDNVCFRQTDDGWEINCGPGMPTNAKSIHGPGWEGIYGRATCGMTDKFGFHGAAWNCYHAVISNGQVSATFEFDNPKSQTEVLSVIRSFRFLPESKKSPKQESKPQ